MAQCCLGILNEREVVCVSGRAMCSWQRYEALYVWKRLVSSFYARLAGRANRGIELGG